jgi:hypothetical protein
MGQKTRRGLHGRSCLRRRRHSAASAATYIIYYHRWHLLTPAASSGSSSLVLFEGDGNGDAFTRASHEACRVTPATGADGRFATLDPPVIGATRQRNVHHSHLPSCGTHRLPGGPRLRFASLRFAAVLISRTSSASSGAPALRLRGAVAADLPCLWCRLPPVAPQNEAESVKGQAGRSAREGGLRPSRPHAGWIRLWAPLLFAFGRPTLPPRTVSGTTLASVVKHATLVVSALLTNALGYGRELDRVDLTVVASSQRTRERPPQAGSR